MKVHKALTNKNQINSLYTTLHMYNQTVFLPNHILISSSGLRRIIFFTCSYFIFSIVIFGRSHARIGRKKKKTIHPTPQTNHNQQPQLTAPCASGCSFLFLFLSCYLETCSMVPSPPQFPPQFPPPPLLVEICSLVSGRMR